MIFDTFDTSKGYVELQFFFCLVRVHVLSRLFVCFSGLYEI